jgi:hypothetical protein
MLLGYALSCLNRVTPPNDTAPGGGLTRWLIEPPPLPPSLPANLWTMSQRAGSVSYQTFAAGFALVAYAAFVLLCDRGRVKLGVLQSLGENALAAYIIHDLVADALKPYLPADAPAWYVLAMFALFLGICLVCVRYLNRHRLYLRL